MYEIETSRRDALKNSLVRFFATSQLVNKNRSCGFPWNYLCLRHSSFTSPLSGAPLPKKNPGSTVRMDPLVKKIMFSFDQSLNQTDVQSANSTSQLNQPASLSVGQSVSQIASQSVSKSGSQPASLPLLPVSQSISQPAGQPVSQSVSQSVSPSVSQSLRPSFINPFDYSSIKSVGQSIVELACQSRVQ